MIKSIKVFFILSNYPSEVFPNKGIFFKRLAEGLEKHCPNLSFVIVAPVPYSNKLIEFFVSKLRGYSKIPEIEIKGRIKVYRPRFLRLPFVHSLYLSHLLQINALRKILKLERPDLIDFRTSYPPYPLSSLVLMLNKEFGVPFMYTINGIHVLPEDDQNLRNKENFSQLLKNASRVQSVSVQLANSMRSIANIEVGLTNHPIDVEYITEISRAKFKKINFDQDPNCVYFLFVGELSKEKGVDTLIESFLAIKDKSIKLLLVGKGEFFEQVKDPKIIFLGLLENAEVLRLMTKMDYFIFPTRFEGMPNVLKEAGAIGLPIISSGAGGIPEFLNHGQFGYLLPEVTIEFLKESIYYALKFKNDMEEKANLLKQFVKDNFDTKITSVRLEKVYRDITLNQ